MRDLLGTLAFVAGVAVLAVGLKMSARAVLFDEKLHPIPAIDSLSEAAQILVYGSSHARVGLNPSLFSQPAINLGTNMMDYIVEHRLVEKTLDVVPGLKVAIVELDVMLPARTMARVPNLRGFYVLGLAPWDLGPGSLWQRIHRYWMWIAGPDLIYERLTPRDVWDPQLSPASPHPPGMNSLHGTIEPWRDGRIMARFQLGMYRRSSADYRVNLRALHRTIARIRARDIPVVLVHWPCHDSYWATGPVRSRSS